ncbi:MAG: hypothetical protein HY926_09635 [Elusimicrobia bacterium]|nr:hypothetical protein [Elusimicrobiota bacterium]
MKRITKASAALISLCLVSSSLPLPVRAAVAARVQTGQAAAPAGAMVLPGGAISTSLGSGSSLSAANGLRLSGALSLPQSPIPSAGVAAAAPLSAPSAETPAAVPSVLAQSPVLAAPAGAPGSVLSALAAEVQEQAAPVQRRSLLGRIGDAVRAKLGFGRVFDNSVPAPGAVAGILPHSTPKELAGLVLDQPPASPDPRKVSGIVIENFAVPGTRGLGGIFSAGHTVLKADAANEADIERALREMVDNDPARFGVPSSELKTIHVRRVPGVGHQTDTVYAYFRQTKDGIEMHGSALSFTIKVLKGRPVVMAAMARLYPNTPVDTAPRFPDDQLKDKAMARLGPLAQLFGLELQFIERKIIYSQDAWHTANLYKVVGLPAMVAVDVATGEAFAWDPRAGAVAQDTTGRVLGHTTVKGPTKPDSPLADRALPDLRVRLGGVNVFTDADGRFIAPAGSEDSTFQAYLSGLWAQVSNSGADDLVLNGTLKPGTDNTLTFNPAGMTEEAIAQVNGYLLTTLVHDWAKTRGLNDARLDKAIAVNVNIDDECNAYYTPYAPSLNFFKSSENCVNSAYDTVVMHEYGHFIDDMLGGIVNGGLSEGWGDIFSMYILNNPIIGEGFLKKPRNGVDYIRHGENTYQYSDSDEVHDQGQAWGGFAWKLRKSLMAKFGAAAGAALAESLVVPTILAKAADIPSAMAQVLLNDMDGSGVMPHEAEIRAAAAAHGVALPQKPGLVSMVRRAASWVTQGLAGAGVRLAAPPMAWRSILPTVTSRGEAAERLMELDREAFAKMMDAGLKGVLLTVLSAAAYLIQPVLTIGVGLVALAQYYRLAKFMALHNKLQKQIQEQLLQMRQALREALPGLFGR